VPKQKAPITKQTQSIPHGQLLEEQVSLCRCPDTVMVSTDFSANVMLCPPLEQLILVGAEQDLSPPAMNYPNLLHNSTYLRHKQMVSQKPCSREGAVAGEDAGPRPRHCVKAGEAALA